MSLEGAETLWLAYGVCLLIGGLIAYNALYETIRK